MPVCSDAIALLLALLAAAPALAQKREGNWHNDFDQAIAEARKKNKDLLIDFTGSDWCGMCQKLEREVYSKKDFAVALQKRFVLVRLDYPRGAMAKRQVPDQKRNAAVATEYGVTTYPTLVLTSPRGDAYGRVSGYLDGGPKAFLKELDGLRNGTRKVLAESLVIEDAMATAKGTAREAVLTKAVDKLKELEPGAPAQRPLLRVARQAFAIDPDNQKGLLHPSIRAALLSGAVDAELAELVRAYDPRDDKGIYHLIAEGMLKSARTQEQIQASADEVERLLAIKPKDMQAHANLVLDIAIKLYEDTEDKARAKKLATVAIELGVQGEDRQRLERLLDA